MQRLCQQAALGLNEEILGETPEKSAPARRIIAALLSQRSLLFSIHRRLEPYDTPSSLKFAAGGVIDSNGSTIIHFKGSSLHALSAGLQARSRDFRAFFREFEE